MHTKHFARSGPPQPLVAVVVVGRMSPSADTATLYCRAELHADPPVFAAGTGVHFNETHAAHPDGQVLTTYTLLAFDATTGALRASVPVGFDS